MASTNATITRRLNKVLEIPLDNQEFLTALQNLSTFYGKNSLAARRNLRGQIEKRGLEINEEFLNVFLQVQKNLDEVQESVNQMRLCCDEMSDRLKTTHEVAGKLIHQADKLNDQRKLNENCREIIHNFLDRFQLTEDELNALKVPDINEDFFVALQRVHQIHADCRILLRTQHQRAGLEIMDAMSVHQEAAYRRLYRWIRNECRRFESPVAEITPLMRKAITALKERPALLSYCLDEISSTRSKSVAKSFLIALTQGGPNGMPRPIEMHAHDPMRYIGDMLAWIHQAVASESELMHNVIEGTPSKETGKIHRIASTEVTDMSEQLIKVLDTIFEGVSRPFRVRLAQVLATKPPIVIVFKLQNLLDFYSRTIEKVIGNKATLVTILVESKKDTLKLFYDLLKENADKMSSSPPSAPANLAPPQEIYEWINRLGEIVGIFDASLVPVEEREAEFKPILAAIVDPLVNICTLSATRLGMANMAVFMINCLSVMQNALALYDFASARVEKIAEHIKAHMDTVVSDQASALLSSCGFAQKLAVIQTTAPEVALSSVPGMEPSALIETMRNFEGVFSGSSAVLTPQIDRLINAQLRSYARSSVSQLIYEGYLVFYQAIVDKKNGYEDPDSLFLYKPEQVKMMVDAL